jgi:hypothetical protein
MAVEQVAGQQSSSLAHAVVVVVWQTASQAIAVPV